MPPSPALPVVWGGPGSPVVEERQVEDERFLPSEQAEPRGDLEGPRRQSQEVQGQVTGDIAWSVTGWPPARVGEGARLQALAGGNAP